MWRAFTPSCFSLVCKPSVCEATRVHLFSLEGNGRGLHPLRFGEPIPWPIRRPDGSAPLQPEQEESLQSPLTKTEAPDHGPENGRCRRLAQKYEPDCPERATGTRGLTDCIFYILPRTSSSDLTDVSFFSLFLLVGFAVSIRNSPARLKVINLRVCRRHREEIRWHLVLSRSGDTRKTALSRASTRSSSAIPFRIALRTFSSYNHACCAVLSESLAQKWRSGD
jgi:hypothetical protein